MKKCVNIKYSYAHSPGTDYSSKLILSTAFECFYLSLIYINYDKFELPCASYPYVQNICCYTFIYYKQQRKLLKEKTDVVPLKMFTYYKITISYCLMGNKLVYNIFYNMYKMFLLFQESIYKQFLVNYIHIRKVMARQMFFVQNIKFYVTIV